MLEAQCDAVVANALRRLNRTLGASTATVYFLTATGRDLAASITLDTPLAFTVIPAMSTTYTRNAVALSHKTGKLVVMGPEDLRKMIDDRPEMIQYIPYPMEVACTPLTVRGERVGTLALRWIPPGGLDSASLGHLKKAAHELSDTLAGLTAAGASLEAPVIPKFVPDRSDRGGDGDAVTPPAVTAFSPDEFGQGPGRKSAFLYQLQRLSGELLAAARTPDVFAAAYRQLVRAFGGHGMMLFLAEDGRLRVVGSGGVPKELSHRIDGTLLTRDTPETDAAVATKALFFESPAELRAVYPELNRYGDGQAQSFLPLIANGRSVGCCVLLGDRSLAGNSDRLAIFMTMLGLVAQSLQRARSHELGQALVRNMQQGLLPRNMPHLSEIATTGRYMPATVGAEVGGDWYDVISLPDGGIGLVIGDVEGHSLEAAGVMGQIRSGVRAYATEGHDPASVLTRSNRLLCGLDTDLFATCCCVWLDLTTGITHVATAGHHAPCVLDAEGGVVELPLPAGPPLGIDREAAYGDSEITLSPGAVVALYTDGLVNAGHRPPDSGLGRLRRHLAEDRGENLEVLADRVVSTNDVGSRREDDVALLLMRYEGTAKSGHGRVARMSAQRHDLRSVRQVRRFLRDVLGDWGLEALLPELELLTSEVVTNALIHAHSEVDVRLRESPQCLRVEVRDSDPHPPVPVAYMATEEGPSQESESGRGLLIVDAVASDWGSSPAARGKTTWFEMALPPDAVSERENLGAGAH